MSQLSQGEALLARAVRDLKRAWEDTGGDWHDSARVDYEAEFIKDFVDQGARAVNAANNLRLLLSKAIEECK